MTIRGSRIMDDTTSKDLEAIEDLHRRDVAATKGGDFEMLMSLMDENASFSRLTASLRAGRLI